MHPQLQAWQDGFLAARDEARRLTDGLDTAAFNRPPAPGRWSVGQCLAHLNTAGGLLVPGLEAALARQRARGRTGAAPYRLGLAGGPFAQTLRPGTRATKTFAAFVPPAEPLDPAATLAAFTALNERLAALVRSAEGLDFARARVSSPALPLLRLNAAAWFEATLNHERRHLTQARAARAELGL